MSKKESLTWDNLRSIYLPGEKKAEVMRIKFKGKEYLLIGDKTSGGIATQSQYDNFETSFAYLCKNGEVKRFNQVIGSKDDIEFIEEE